MSEATIHTDPVTGGMKGEKPVRIDLIPAEAEEAEGLCYGLGAEKYSENNWKLGYAYSKSLAALYRHLNAWKRGEIYDADGFHHLGAVRFHCATLIYNEIHHPEMDDVHFLAPPRPAENAVASHREAASSIRDVVAALLDDCHTVVFSEGKHVDPGWRT